MVNQGRNWDHELQRLLADNDQGCPTMVVLDGPLVLFNSYDLRYTMSTQHHHGPANFNLIGDTSNCLTLELIMAYCGFFL